MAMTIDSVPPEVMAPHVSAPPLKRLQHMETTSAWRAVSKGGG